MPATRRGLAAVMLTLTLARPVAAQDAATDQARTPPPPSQTAETYQPDPFVHLLQNTLRDLKGLASIDTAWTLGLGGAASAASHPADDYVTEHATAGGTKAFFDVGGNAGTGYVHAGGAVATYVVGRLAHSPRTANAGADLIRGQVLDTILTQGIKASVRRHRPGRTDGSFAFPSGHTSSAWTSATVLWRHFGWKAGVPASAVGAWVAAGRVQQGQHFLSDVVFGAAVGIASGRTVTIGHGRRALRVGPSPVAGGVAVTFTPARAE